jgi:hypothetical protein
MAMAQHTQDSQDRPTFSVELTHPTTQVAISTDHHVRDNQPRMQVVSYQDFFDQLSAPDARDHRKDGPGWYNGACSGRRTAANFSAFQFAVLDADSSFDEDGSIIEGAPPPREVHKVLAGSGLSHHIYTTYSHGSWKGSRYRVVFPCFTENKAQLRAVLLYYHEIITSAGLPLALSRESYTIPNRWHFPRTEDADAPFYSTTFYGYQLSLPGVRYLAQHYQQANALGEEEIGSAPAIRGDTIGRAASNQLSLLDAFCAAFRIEDILSAHGYTFHGYHLMTDAHGREMQALRFKKPDSSSGPGVIVFDAGEKQRLFSHHSNDVLATGQAIDAFDVYMRLNGIEQPRHYEVAVALLQEYELESMNRTYPSILVSGTKFRFAHVVQGFDGAREYKFLAPLDCKMFLANQQGIYEMGHTEEGPKLQLKSRYEWWAGHPERIGYKNIVFVPKPMRECLESKSGQFHVMRGKDMYFNLFAGWPTKPKQGPWPMIEWHFRNVLCGGNEEHYNYLMDWLAHILQYPEVKPNVAVVFRGNKGTGKSLIMSAISRALGPLGMVISHSKHLTGSFNSHLRNKLFTLVEESFFSGSPMEESVLKHMISDNETTYEAKGYEAEGGQSYLRACLITNSEWAAPASGDERRYFIPTVTDAAIIRNREEGGTYFTRLSQEIAGGGIAALFYELMNRSISAANVRRAPDSAELQKQKLLTLHGNGAWLLDALMMGRIAGTRGAEPIALEQYPRYTSIKADVLADSLLPYMKNHDSSRSQLLRLRTLLDSLFVVTSEIRGTDMYLTLPPLQTMREAFCRHYNVEPFW